MHERLPGHTSVVAAQLGEFKRAQLLCTGSPSLHAVFGSGNVQWCPFVPPRPVQVEVVIAYIAHCGSTQRGTRAPANWAADNSGGTTLMRTPVPSSNPARVVTLGKMWACQWNGP